MEKSWIEWRDCSCERCAVFYEDFRLPPITDWSLLIGTQRARATAAVCDQLQIKWDTGYEKHEIYSICGPIAI